MKISVIGSGYVGSVTAACFADVGHEVVCVDIDKAKVEQINAGIPPIYEEGLEELLQKYAGKRLIATADTEFAVDETDISFICGFEPLMEEMVGKIMISGSDRPAFKVLAILFKGIKYL